MLSHDSCLQRLMGALDAAVLAGSGAGLSLSAWTSCGPLLARLARPALLRQAEAALSGALRWGPDADERLPVLALALVERLAGCGGRLVALAQSGDAVTAVLEDGDEPISPVAFRQWVAAVSYALFGEAMAGQLAAPALAAAAAPDSDLRRPAA